jgi:hypothetical protein
MMDKTFLADLYRRGKPLAEIHVVPAEGEGISLLIDAINGLAPDIAVGEGRYNTLIRAGQLAGHRLTIEGDATREALERLFGWRLRRARLPRWDQVKGVYDGYHEDAFCWEEECSPQHYPAGLEGRIEAMSLSQPGTNDNGQADTVEYKLP